MRGVRPPGGVYIHIAGIDLADLASVQEFADGLVEARRRTGRGSNLACLLERSTRDDAITDRLRVPRAQSGVEPVKPAVGTARRRNPSGLPGSNPNQCAWWM